MTSSTPTNNEELDDILSNLTFQTIALEDDDTTDEVEAEAKQSLLSWRDAAVVEAEKNAVAWAIGQIDDMHFNTPHTETFIGDSLFKGIKNSLRDRAKLQAGYDPAPNYPINASLKQSNKWHKF